MSNKRKVRFNKGDQVSLTKRYPIMSIVDFENTKREFSEHSEKDDKWIRIFYMHDHIHNSDLLMFDGYDLSLSARQKERNYSREGNEYVILVANVLFLRLIHPLKGIVYLRIEEEHRKENAESRFNEEYVWKVIRRFIRPAVSREFLKLESTKAHLTSLKRKRGHAKRRFERAEKNFQEIEHMILDQESEIKEIRQLLVEKGEIDA